MVYILKEQLMEKELEYLKAKRELMEKIENYTHTDVTKINTAKILTKTQDVKNKLDALRATKTALTGAKTNIDREICFYVLFCLL